MRRIEYNWYDKHAQLRHFYQELQQRNEVTQITVTNHTDAIRKVTLWGANACLALTNPMFLNEVINTTILVEKQPQSIAYNPVNDAFYVVNQLSNSVSVISSIGNLVTTLSLGLSPLPGGLSPVAVTVNTNRTSPEYGTVAVACSVSNEIVFIDANNTITRRENVGVRPIDIVYNTFDDCYYSISIVSGTLSKISAVTTVKNFLLVDTPRTISFNPDNGDLYVFSSKTKQVQIFDSEGIQKGTYAAINAEALKFKYHPVTKTMFLVADTIGVIDIIDTNTFTIITRIGIGNDPVAIDYNPHNGLMYVATRGDQKIVRINTQYQIVDRIERLDFNTGMAINTQNDVIALSNSSNDTVTIFGEQKTPTVTVNEAYYEDREDFQHNPTLINHLKIVASGDDRINALQLIEKSVAGKELCKTVSLSNYHSPQNFGNVSDVFAMDGELIDGHSIWCFKINPKQVVTFLIYHKQFEMYSVLPEKSRVSTGVQMSQGIPASWHDNYKNEQPDESNY